MGIPQSVARCSRVHLSLRASNASNDGTTTALSRASAARCWDTRRVVTSVTGITTSTCSRTTNAESHAPKASGCRYGDG